VRHSHSFRRGTLMCGTALAGALTLAASLTVPSGAAHAQSTQTLRLEINNLQQRLQALEAQQAETQRAQQATAAQAAQAQQAAAQASNLQGSFPGSIRIPGTNTSVRLYGFVRTTGTYDFEGRNRAPFQNSNAVPLTTGAAERQGGDFAFSARYSRLGFETRTDSPWGPVRSVVEMDFGGAQSTASTTSQASWIPRLRHAYVEAGNFLAGQTTTLFGDTLALDMIDFGTFVGLSATRQAQVRYTAPIGGGATWAFSLENPYSDYTYTGGFTVPDSDTTPALAVNRFPDFVTSLKIPGDWGHVALQGVVRRIDFTNDGATLPAQRFSDETWGYGVALNGVLNTVGKNRFMTRVAYGDGVGRYIDNMGAGASSNVGLAGVTTPELDTNKVFSAMLGYQHFWADNLRSTVAGGFARITYPSYARQFSASTQNTQNRDMTQGIANIIWTPFQNLDLGLEYNVGTRQLLEASSEGATRGFGQRITALVKYNF
jgi:hypothetical protein